MENIKQLQKLAEVFDTDKIITSDEIEQVLKGILVIMNSFKKDNQTLNKETKEVVEILLDKVLTENAKLKELVNRETSDQKEDFAKQVKELKDLVSKVQTIKPIDGIDGKDADEEKIVEDVLAKIKLPEYEVYTLEEKGEEIVNEINALPDNSEYKIDAKHIKNLPEFKGNRYYGGSGIIKEIIAGTNITVDNTNLGYPVINATGGGGGAVDSVNGETGVVVLTTGDIAEDTDFNYVSDAQLTVIGNTSGTNTGDQDISGKADKSGALTQFVGNGNWKVFYSDGSGDIIELALGADGTFLKSNGASSAPTFSVPAGTGDVSKVGTPANNQIGVWTGDGTIEGDASLTWDGTSFNIATAKNFQIAGATILADAAGTTTLSNIDALDATTEATIEGAIDTLENLTSIQGRVLTLADAGANAVFGWDDVAGAYENLTAGEVRGATGLATTDSPQFTGIELGHATDTTISRVSAGLIAVEGNNVARSTDIQVFTSTGANTWTKPTNAKIVEVVLIGGGGGGGSGRKGASLSDRSGGSGGAGGGYSKLTISASLLGSSETATVGAGGAGGAAQATNSTNGNNGTAGGNTTFGVFAYAGGGNAGNGGDTDASTSIPVEGGKGTGYPAHTDSNTHTHTQGASGYGGLNFDGGGGNYDWDSTTDNTMYWIAGGAGGGGIDVLNAVYNGGVGGAGSYLKDGTGNAGGTGGTGAAGGNGTATTANSPYGGGGGGGGGARHAGGNAYAGGNGGIYGAGGGGGGASTDAVGNSGAGGNGANGIAIITTYF